VESFHREDHLRRIAEEAQAIDYAYAMTAAGTSSRRNHDRIQEH
jgi:hypothetical protein